MATPADVRQMLIDNPPPKCPYFTLPDVCHFPKVTRVSKARKKTGYISIVSLWGQSTEMDEETTTEFLLQLLKHSDWEPDFEAIAAEWQLNGTSHIKSRLKAIVEAQGYELIGESKIVGGNGATKQAALPPAKKARAKKDKGIKGNADDSSDEVTKASGAKKRKATDTAEVSKPKATKKRRQPTEATWTTPGSLDPESEQDVTEDRGAQVSANLEASAHELGAEEISLREETGLET